MLLTGHVHLSCMMVKLKMALYREYSNSQTLMEQVLLYGALSSTVNSWWMAIPNSSMSFILLGVGAYEFFCAQTPYSMRGLIFGCAKGSAIVFLLIGYGISEPFTQHLINWGTGTISCGFWYLLSMGLLMMIFTAMLLILIIKYYKYRKRERMCYQMNISLLKNTMTKIN